jgi:hypothetical protein
VCGVVLHQGLYFIWTISKQKLKKTKGYQKKNKNREKETIVGGWTKQVYIHACA